MNEHETAQELIRLNGKIDQVFIKSKENYSLICETNDKLLGRIEELQRKLGELKQEIDMLKVDLLKSGYELSYKE